MIELNKIYNEDCLEGMKNIEDKSIDMILCDLPYGTTKCKWDTTIPFDKLWEQYKRIIKDKGAIVLFGSEPFSSSLRVSNIKEYKYDWKWNKVTGTGHLCARFQPMQQIEDIMVFANGKTIYNPQLIELTKEEYKKKIGKITKRKSYDSTSELTSHKKELSIEDRDLEKYKYKQPSNLLTYSKYMKECNNVKRLHPTQKPVELLEYLIKTYSNENEIVLDNCIGSGSTAIACINTNRNYIGFEMDSTYFDLANKRIEEHIPNEI